MELHDMQQGAARRKNRKRIGRGPASGTGKTAGKGHKGQKARSGYARKQGFEGGQMPLSRRLPKRGFHHEGRYPASIVNISVLEQHFDSGAEITPETLSAAGLVKVSKGGVKLLGHGDLTKKLAVTVNAISAGARQKIEAAGGSVAVQPIVSEPHRPQKRDGQAKEA